MKGIPVRVLLALLLAGLGDYLLFGHQPGCGVAIFALVVAAAVSVEHSAHLAWAGRWALLWLLLALGAAWQATPLGLVLVVVLAWTVLAMAFDRGGKPLAGALARGVTGGAGSFTRLFADLAGLKFSRGARVRLGGLPAWVVFVPALIIAAFAALIIPANLVLAEWASQFWSWLSQAIADLVEWLLEISWWRVVFWIVMGLGVYGLFRFRPLRGLRGRKEAALAPPPPPGSGRHELAATVATFAGLNLLFLAANGADAAYLWFGSKLPEGLTYSKFAHLGSYRLIAAVVLSAITVTAFFRTSARAAKSWPAMLLAYLFIAQNLMILAGGGRRLQLYVGAYGLTRFRVATFIWMALVLTGFILIFIKLRHGRKFAFLVRTNVVSVVLFLSAASLANIDGFIARWNVSHYLRGAHETVDIDYLKHLGLPAAPALAHLARSDYSPAAFEASQATAQMLREFDSRPWQSWTLRDHLAAERARGEIRADVMSEPASSTGRTDTAQGAPSRSDLPGD